MWGLEYIGWSGWQYWHQSWPGRKYDCIEGSVGWVGRPFGGTGRLEVDLESNLGVWMANSWTCNIMLMGEAIWWGHEAIWWG